MKYTVAQIEVISGQPKANFAKCQEYVGKAKLDGSDVIVFPESCIGGYLIGDDWERHDYMDECVHYTNELVSLSEDITIVFGSVITGNCKGEDGRIRKYNSAIVANNKKIRGIYVKTLQPNYREFDDNRHFFDSRKILFNKFTSFGNSDWNNLIPDEVAVNGILTPDLKYTPPAITVECKDGSKTRIGVCLCEDGWEDDYGFSILKTISKHSDIIFNLSCSPFTINKNDKRNRVFIHNVDKYFKPIVYVNNVGIQNNGKNVFMFDGGTTIYKDNQALNVFSPFEEGYKTFVMSEEKEICQYDDEYIPLLHKSLVYGAKKTLEQFGIKNIVIGASGGIDSALVAAIYSLILPPQNIHLLNMPYRFNSTTTIGAAEELAQNIGCNYYPVPIHDYVDPIFNHVKQQFGDKDNWDFVLENIQARARSSTVLAAYAAAVNGVFTCNGNKSELTVGYATLYGDVGGFLSLLGDVWKTDVYKLAIYHKEKYGIIPNTSITVKASAELSPNHNVDLGKGDPLIYEYHDKLFYLWTENWNRMTAYDCLKLYVDGELSKKVNFDVEYLFPDVESFINDLEKWWTLHDGMSYYKRIQAPPILSVSKRAYGFDLRETQKKAFYSHRYQELKNKVLNKE